jgi:hypothetical protein
MESMVALVLIISHISSCTLMCDIAQISQIERLEQMSWTRQSSLVVVLLKLECTEAGPRRKCGGSS